ncbi:DMT family transporter [Allobranchiibius sp. CTAmp26]|uniref:DMT family transporter n=1 Tax=Allobranchiibius sp. CTAmp26 TaxID=2815214 RepID=UPI001AA0BF43|nr:DMT family transporter [Allobranchiibius sp. CTAmp26]MBO1754971.1 DMT family transporter [Allobranchiibius sp. CTAmp26]
MTGNVLVVVVSLAAAFAFAVSAVLKHSTATRVPQLAGFTVRQLWRFGVSTVLHPLWLLSLVADLMGVVLQVVALHIGAISVVQPVLSLGLLFALLLRHVEARTIPGAEIRWAVLLVSTLIGFLFVSGISSVNAKFERVDQIPASIAAAIGIVIITVCVVLARRAHTMQWRTTSLGIAVAILYAINAALLKTCTQKFTHGIPTLLTSWAPYAVVVVGVSGILLCQLAYQAGPLVASQPTIAVVDPLASVVIGIVVYDETLRHGWWVFPAMVVLLALMSVAIARLAAVEPAPALTPGALGHD